jgi:hypothetical protein
MAAYTAAHDTIVQCRQAAYAPAGFAGTSNCLNTLIQRVKKRVLINIGTLFLFDKK